MSTLVGTGGLVRLILRRDRLLLPTWIVLFAVLPVQYAVATDQLFPTAAHRQEYYDSIVTNPALLGFLGPVFDASLGALVTWRIGVLFAIVGLVSLLTVLRHTRTEEEAGRCELLGANVVGRHAPLAAALAATFGADLLLAGLLAAGMAGVGLPVAGAVALGLSMAAAGWVFAAVGAVAAQLTQGAGAARGVAIGALGGAFLLRAAGDAGGRGGRLGWLSWLSPLGWVQQAQPYAGERWWVHGLALGLVVALVAVAVAVLSRRDMGAGVLPARLGPAVAAAGLRSPLALAWRLHRGMLAGWTAGFAVAGAVVGGVVETTMDMAAGNSQLRDALERLGGQTGLVDAYLASTVGFMALVAAGYAVAATLRLRTEEVGLRAEPVLATAVGRPRWAASHLAFGLLGPAAALTAYGLAAGLAYGLTTGDVGGQLPRVLAGALVTLPAVWVLSGIAAGLFGLLPRLAPVSWAVLAVFALLVLLELLMELDQWLLDLAPFTHIPKLPGGDMSTTPLAWLVAITAVLIAGGLGRFRRRDLVSA
jgi:ABC-2 type transport system permease protein